MAGAAPTCLGSAEADLDETVLLGRAGFFLMGGRKGVGGPANTFRDAGRTNIPEPIGQSKYRSPPTLPSFLPDASSSSTPTQTPGAKAVWPAKRMMASRPSLSWTLRPSASSDKDMLP